MLTKIQPRRIAALLASMAMAAACSAGSAAPQSGGSFQKNQVPLAGGAQQYEKLVVQARKMSFTLDFGKLRDAYRQSGQFKRAAETAAIQLPLIYEAISEDDYKRCLEVVDSYLRADFMSMEAHIAGIRCSSQYQALEREDFHLYMVGGLIDSIERSGDGQTVETAYKTLNFAESKGFLLLKGYEITGRWVEQHGTAFVDRMEVREPGTGRRHSLYFDISGQSLVKSPAQSAR